MRREDCRRLDAADDLAHLRDRFVIPDGLIYLDGNSLGLLPKHVPERMLDVIEHQWGEGLIRSWVAHGWIELPFRVGDRIGALIGAPPGTVAAVDSTSVNLYKVVSAARRLGDRPVVVTDSGNFPTDVYVMSGLGETRLVEPERVVAAIDGDVGVVALTQVDYRTGRRHDLEEITEAAHAAGALMIWDLAHSAGAFPVDLSGAGVDFAVGCGYKYLNGGPGAPAFLYVAERHLDHFVNPITGWLGHAAPFEFDLEFRPADGVARTQVGTPHLLSLAALDAALDVFDDVDLEAIRRKSLSLTEVFMELLDDRIPEVEVVTPRDPSRRGSQVSVRHPNGYAVMQALIEAGVVGDFRAPDIMRFGLAPAYLSHVDAFDAVESLRSVLDDGRWRDPRYARRATVT